MGNWNLTIRGVGQHHNGQPRDVEKLAAGIVDHLRRNGHTIVNATVTIGGEVDVTLGANPASQLYGDKAKSPATAIPPGMIGGASPGAIGFGDGNPGS
jgi:hypothetical protein